MSRIHPVYSSDATIYFMNQDNKRITIKEKNFSRELEIKLETFLDNFSIDWNLRIRRGDYFFLQTKLLFH